MTAPLKWVYCELCEEIVKRRFHFFMHVVAESMANRILVAGAKLRRHR